MRRTIAVVAALVALAGCAKEADIFPDLGDNVAAPSAIWIDVASNRLYLNNSNSKVLYDSTQGNFQVYDLTNPLAPVLLDTLPLLSFSGQLYVDTVRKIAWTPNRYTANNQATTGVLYGINIDEASAGYLTFTETTIDANAFGLACCYPADRAWIPNELTTATQELQYADLGAGTATIGAQSLLSPVDSGGSITQAQTTYIAIIGNQAFLSRIYGGIMVVNLDEVGVPGATPVDYYIQNIEAPYGLAVDPATNTLYVAGQGNNAGGDWTNYLLVLDVSTLTPTTTNTTTHAVDKTELMQAMITVGNNPMEVALSPQNNVAFVTNANDNTVSVIDTQTNAVRTTIAVGVEPVTMALYTTAGGIEQYMYVANIYDNTLSIIDIPTLTVVATVLK